MFVFLLYFSCKIQTLGMTTNNTTQKKSIKNSSCYSSLFNHVMRDKIVSFYGNYLIPF